MGSFDEIFRKILDDIKNKIQSHQIKVIDSQQFQENIKYFSDFTFDFIDAIRAISLYSTRAKDIYEKQLTIKASDDLIQSAVGIRSLVMDGVHNMAKRELRYLIEMFVKYLIVDQELSEKTIKEKTEYLSTNIPNASIDVIERMRTYFAPSHESEFKSEVSDFFYKFCSYVHPSQRQIEEQISKYKKGFNIGFESAKELSDISKLTFRAYDMLLIMAFTGLGQSMSGDIFIDILDKNSKWKFHKGKYTARFSKLFDEKAERKIKKG
jgi:hypothetical protein